MLKNSDLKNLHIAIATPCYGGSVFQNYLLSMLNLNTAAIRIGMKLDYIIRGGDSLITRTRNSIVAEFLAHETYTHLLWVDADVGFSVEQILRLIAVDRDVVAGVYPLKKIVWPDRIETDMTRKQFEAQNTYFPFNPIDEKADIDEHGFMEVLDAPTGLMLIKRSVFDRMRKSYPGLAYVADEMLGLEHVRDKIEHNHFRFFDVMTEESGRYLSEDYAFVRRWQNIGGKVFVDTKSNLTHQGSHVYTGDFHASLMARHERAAALSANRADNQS